MEEEQEKQLGAVVLRREEKPRPPRLQPRPPRLLVLLQQPGDLVVVGVRVQGLVVVRVKGLVVVRVQGLVVRVQGLVVVRVQGLVVVLVLVLVVRGPLQPLGVRVLLLLRGRHLGRVLLPPLRGAALLLGDECDCTRTPRSYLHLALGHGQAVGQPRALRARQVLGLLEGLLQGEDLLAREGGPRVLPLPVLVQQDGVICKRETVRGLGDITRDSGNPTKLLRGEQEKRASLQWGLCITPGQKIGVLPGRSAKGFGYRATATAAAPGLKYSPGGGGGLRLLNRDRPDKSPAEEEAEDAATVAPRSDAEGRLRMSFIPCGVAEEQSCGEPSPEDSPEELLLPGDDAAMPPGFGDVVAGDVEQLGPAQDSG
ncbi:hypothetical protein EYF80_045557 [Liparis tanakae]|uniref:Uncharacterized protein n=1 Tax=Liparis tanakae TaxID=230148 RepID=A0A4Z2FSU4_9TELE|nr:hypothetical protein EYF80_045557 [Liparis tanakae]